MRRHVVSRGPAGEWVVGDKGDGGEAPLGLVPCGALQHRGGPLHAAAALQVAAHTLQRAAEVLQPTMATPPPLREAAQVVHRTAATQRQRTAEMLQHVAAGQVAAGVAGPLCGRRPYRPPQLRNLSAVITAVTDTGVSGLRAALLHLALSHRGRKLGGEERVV